MLTMGKPIALQCVRPVGTLGEMFGERIRADYEQMQGRFDPAEILHFLSVPPELYLIGTGMTMLVNQGDAEERYHVQLSLINNVLNRILISENLMLTYQDRVFVENMLRKLGVTDVRKWIGQIRMIKEETGSVRELLSLYESKWDAVHLIREYRREHSGRQKKAGVHRKAGEEETAQRLAAAVLKRLQTAAACREVGRYMVSRFGGGTVIDRRELVFSEQDIAVSRLVINDYRSRIFAQDQYAAYNRADWYEGWNSSRTDETYRQTVSRFLQTVLLNAARQIFHIRYEEFTRCTGWRHEFTDALHVSVRNTLQRFADQSESVFFPIRDPDGYQKTVQYFAREEIGALKNLFAKSTEMTALMAREEKDRQAGLQDRDTIYGRYHRETDSGGMRQETADRRKISPQETAMIRREWEKELRKQLNRIDRQNRERMERLSEYSRQEREVSERRIDHEMTKAGILRTLTGQEQAAAVYQERESRQETEIEQETEKLREILGDETVRVFETIRRYREDSGRYPNRITAEGQAMHLLRQDIAAAEKMKKGISGITPEAVVYDEVQRAAAEEARTPKETAPGVQSGKHGPERTSGETEYTVELFHRQNGQTLSEERLQELLKTREKDLRIQNTEVRRTVREEAQVTEIVQSKVNEMKAKQDEEIARMIGQNVKRQLDTLSEKVYGKLERRMDAERRRRGL